MEPVLSLPTSTPTADVRRILRFLSARYVPVVECPERSRNYLPANLFHSFPGSGCRLLPLGGLQHQFCLACSEIHFLASWVFSQVVSCVIHTYGRSWTHAGSPCRLCRACILAGLPPSDGVGSALTKPHTLAEKYFAMIQNQRSSAIKAIYIRPPHPPILVRLSQLTLRGSNAVPRN